MSSAAGRASGAARRAALRERDLDWRARVDAGETLSAVARTDGVSTSTVMRAIARLPVGAGRCVNGLPGVTPETPECHPTDAAHERTRPAAPIARTEVTEAVRRACEQERGRIKVRAALAEARKRQHYREATA